MYTLVVLSKLKIVNCECQTKTLPFSCRSTIVTMLPMHATTNGIGSTVWCVMALHSEYMQGTQGKNIRKFFESRRPILHISKNQSNIFILESDLIVLFI